jgi:glycine/D-amino acid oxidase-like deaminating enzyme/nitrite reductase/ring-hydroxylating ferredoxin subunit
METASHPQLADVHPATPASPYAAKDCSHSTRSLWAATSPPADAGELQGDTTADVCIVGAGIAGLTTAYLLGKQGKKVVVLDANRPTAGQSQQTTAHLSNAIDDRYIEIERLHGEAGARLAAESHTAAINHIERIVHEERIACDFQRVDGFLFAPPDNSTDLLDRELAAARRAGLVVEQVQRAPIANFDTGPALRFSHQGQFHPLRYLAHLMDAIRRDGGRIYGSTFAHDIEGGEHARVVTRGGQTVAAGAVVVATNTPINDMVAIHTKQAPYLTYVIACPVPRNSVPRALYWDTLDPYHYVRTQPGDSQTSAPPVDLLIIGGEDHKTGQANDGADRFARLEAWAKRRFTIGPIEYRWSGQCMETIDGLAFIGRNPMDKDNVYIATGDSGMGMTHGTIAGLLLTELILGNDHPWRTLYDPARKTLRAAGQYAKENINVAGEYAAWLTSGDVKSEDEIAPGSGAIVRAGLQKIAVYRDNDGRLTRCSAACTHLKCVVAWNTAESTWDCPCHGSRFDPHGKVLSGPAISDLAPYQEPDAEK